MLLLLPVICNLLSASNLPRMVATIHDQIAASHVATCVAQQKHRCTAVLLRLGQSAQHILLWPVLLPAGVFVEQDRDHRGHNVPWGNGVDPDAVFAPFGCKVAGELDDCCFGGIVCAAVEALAEL